MTRKIWTFDTTLRDGEQVPGAKLNLYEKMEVAKQVRNTYDIMITALARAVKGDIDSVYESIKDAEKPLIHMVLGTSDIHVEKKFSKSKDQILDIGVEAVKYAKKLLPDIQYSTEDAS